MPVTQSVSRRYTTKELKILLEVARQTIDCYIKGSTLSKLKASDYPASLLRKGACFVSLHVDGDLQGCIGTTQAQVPLIMEVQRKTWAACCQDRRFTPLQAHQLKGLEVEVSVLSEPEPLDVASEAELLKYLAIHRSGLTLSEGPRRALFLPQVWQQLPEPTQFLSHLKHKGGWPQDYWSETIDLATFEVQSLACNYYSSSVN
ncbi:AmmeMemoRadiSam system protein A [Vibrio sp. WXL103]|uniref:AmmeMemoRadiSam system protein A n=1 Tax=Vibrio sp. WXL103 TaxID=3450710 RepID=UPI003EC71ABE